MRDAEEIFGVARQTGEDCDIAILVGQDGGIHIVEGAGWKLESLRLDSGALAAYEVRRRAGQVRLEGRSVGEHCTLEASGSAKPFAAAMADCPRYLVIS